MRMHPRAPTMSLGCTGHSLPILVAYARRWGRDTRCLVHDRDASSTKPALEQWHRDSLRAPSSCLWLHHASPGQPHPLVRTFGVDGTEQTASWPPAPTPVAVDAADGSDGADGAGDASPVELVSSAAELHRAIHSGPCVVLATRIGDYRQAQAAYAGAASACARAHGATWRWLVVGPRVGESLLRNAGLRRKLPSLLVSMHAQWHVIEGVPSPWRALEYIDELAGPSWTPRSTPARGAASEDTDARRALAALVGIKGLDTVAHERGDSAAAEIPALVEDEDGVLTSMPLLPTDHPLQAIELARALANTGPTPPRPVVVLYYADWCGHCTRFKSIWNDAAQDASARGVYWLAVNESHPHARAALASAGVEGFPTVLRFHGGAVENMATHHAERDKATLLRFARSA
jgi:thiol-disulfide isomerase/thioredoxin